MRLLTRPLRTAQSVATVALTVVRGGVSLVEGTVRRHLPGAGSGAPTDSDTTSAADAARAHTGVDGDLDEEQVREQIAEVLVEEVEEHRRVYGDELFELDEDEQIAQAELMAKHRAQELEEERRRKEAEESATSDTSATS